MASEPSFSATDANGLQLAEEERFQAEVRRIYATSAWVGPVGSMAAALTALLLLWNDLPRQVLIGWMALVCLASACMVASVVVPRLRRWESTIGLPRVAYFAHALNGVAFGLLLWLDPSMVERDDSRWFALTALFAMSAGVASGLNCLSDLGLLVLVPMWTLGLIRLAATGHELVAGGALVFAIVVVAHERRSGDLWRELIDLRIDQERRTEQQRWFAQHDHLTGLPNRAGVMAALGQVDGTATAMYLDLDYFKEVNDQLGHAAGDEVLVEVARRLKSAVRENDVVGRLGGDEFFILFNSPLRPDQLTALGTRIIASLEEPIPTILGVAMVSASAGAATVDGDDVEGAELMQRADYSLMRAKRGGRHRIEVFSQ